MLFVVAVGGCKGLLGKADGCRLTALDVASVWYQFNDLIFYSFGNQNEGKMIKTSKTKAAVVIEVMYIFPIFLGSKFGFLPVRL